MSLNTAVDTGFTAVELAILTDLEKLAEIVKRRGHSCRAYSPKSLVNLKTLPTDKKQLLGRQIKNILQVVAFSPEIEVPPEGHLERSFVEQALSMYDLEAEDDFWGKLEKDDVIEMYSIENIQLFRTFNFFKISSYSLLDLLTNEWYHLWERPSFVLDVFIKAVENIISGASKTSSLESARHVVKEIYNDDSINFKSSSVFIQPVVISPLYAKGTKDVKGFFFTLRGKVVGYDSDSDKIAVI